MMKFPVFILVTLLTLGAPVIGSAQVNPSTTASAPMTAPTSPVVSPTLPSPSSASADAGDIHDIRGPISIPYPWLWAMYGVGAAILAGVLYGVWRFLRRQAAERAKLPHELALDRLEAARELMAPDTVREYAFAVSEIIRGYIEQRFGEKAAHRTTEEFLSDLLHQTDTPLAAHHDLLADFLNHCDLPKFARWQLSGSEMEAMHDSARAFILDTRPAPEKNKTTVLPSPSDASTPPELMAAK
jgi:hypothetical protein